MCLYAPCLTNQCHISIESNQLQGAIPGETHDLGGVEDKAYIVEGLTMRVRICVRICELSSVSSGSLTGATNLRELIALLLSWATKASTRANGVKNVPTEGTKNLNFDRSTFPCVWHCTK